MRSKRGSTTVVGVVVAGLLTVAVAAQALAAKDNPLHPSFSRLDSSQDKMVTKDEFMGYMDKQWSILKGDTDPLHPNYLSPTEFRQADANNDDKVTKEEFMRYEEAMWGKVDTAGKGQITEAEYNRADNPLHPQHGQN